MTGRRHKGTKNEKASVASAGRGILPIMSAALPLPLFDPVLDAIDRAPLVRRLTPEQRAELAQDLEDLAAGRLQLIASEDMPAALEAIRRQHSA